MVDLTPILQAVIALVAALITSKLIPWIKARTTVEQQRTITVLTKTAVYAAEQLYGAGGGKQKLDFVRRWLKRQGYDVDVPTIEAAVREMTANFQDVHGSDKIPIDKPR